MAKFRKFPETIRLKCDGSWYVALSSFVLYLPHVIVMLFMYLDGDRDMWIAGGSRLLLRVFKPGLMSSSQEQIGRADIEVTSIAGMTGSSTRCLLQSRMYADRALFSRDVLKFCTYACRSPRPKVRLRNTEKSASLTRTPVRSFSDLAGTDRGLSSPGFTLSVYGNSGKLNSI
jgi:hypothetical protein